MARNLGLGTCGSSCGSPYGTDAASPAPVPGQGRRGRVTLQQQCLVLQPQKRAQAWVEGHLPLIRGTFPLHSATGRPYHELWPSVTHWHLAAVLPHFAWPLLLGPRSLPGEEATSPKEKLAGAATEMALHANNLPQGTSNCLITPSGASRVSHPSHQPDSVQPGGSAAVITGETSKPTLTSSFLKQSPSCSVKPLAGG